MRVLLVSESNLMEQQPCQQQVSNKITEHTRFWQYLFLLPLLTCFISCASTPDYKSLRIDQARTHFDRLKQQTSAEQGVITLSHAIELALSNNLDLKVKGLQEAIAKERATAATLGMLPEMNIAGTTQNRNNEPGSSSESLISGTQSLEPSKSSEKHENAFEFGALLSVLDFGLSYFNSQQAYDQTYIAAQQQKRQAQNLVQEVTETYLKVAAAQYTAEQAEASLKESDNMTRILEDAQNKQLLSGMKAMEEQIRFYQLKQRLTEYKRSYQNNRFKLCSLMGFYPDGELKIDTSMLKSLQPYATPSVEALEKIALENRPELMENDIREHISQVEAHKAILKMFPNVKLFASFTDSSNKYLYNRSWWEVGVRASFDLLNLPERYFEYEADLKETEQLKAKALALSIGVLTEVRIAQANMVEIKERFDVSDRLYQTRMKYLQTAKQNQGKTEGVTPLEVQRIEMEAVEAATQRALALSSYHMAWYQLLNTLGRDNLPPLENSETKKITISPARTSS